jgi:spermidine/putrescine-binding protein
MKRTYKLLNLCALSIAFLSLNSCSKVENGDIKIFNAGEYIDQNLISKFEEEYSCTVSYSTFESNEAAITKMKTESYDLVIPSDYAVDELVKNDMLQELDWSRINITKDDMTDSLISIIDSLKDSEDPFDILKYGVPYFYGIVGIVYNANVIDEEDVFNEGWSIFKNPKYRNNVAYYDNPRDGFIAPFKELGISLNTNDDEDILKAFEWVKEVKANTNAAYKTDELLSEMPQGKYGLGLMYSGDAIYAMDLEDENVDLRFFVPECGSDVYIDTMVIPKTCKNVDLAYDFINFINDEENAYQNASYVGYTSPLRSVCEAITDVDGDYYEYAEYYFVRSNENDEIYRFNNSLKIKLNDLWVKLKLS